MAETKTEKIIEKLINCPKCGTKLVASGYPKGTPEADALQCKDCGRLYSK